MPSHRPTHFSQRLEKGVRNVEILKQPQYTPYKVENQIAILYCGTKNLLRKIPINRVRDFETEYLHYLEEHHSDTLAELKAGRIDDPVTAVLEKACGIVSKRYEV